MYPMDYQGRALCHQKIVPGNTITGLSAYCYKYKLYKLVIDDADSQIYVGDWIVGATSAAVAKVQYVSVSGWTNGTGYLLIDSWTGTAWTEDEEIKVAAGSTMANVNQPAAIVEATDAEYNLADRLPWKDKLAQYALVIVYANTALVDWSGGKPDQTALIGTPMVAGSSVGLTDHDAMANFKCVDYTAASASIVQIKFHF